MFPMPASQRDSRNKNMVDEHSEDESTIASPSTHISEMDINPNQRLSSVLLNEFNYLPWARAISLALGGRSKLGFINGSHPAPGVTSPKYGGWLCKDQLSSLTLWTTVKEMYGNQNNSARIFQLKKDISNVQQEGKTFVQHLGSLRSMWNELDVYRPHTTDPTVLLKRTEEDKIFQLLSSLSSDYEDLRSHILMNPELPSFTSICATIQCEEVRRKVMNNGTKTIVTEARAYLTNEKRYKGKNPHLKCLHCDNIGHVRDKCWILHPELKPDFMKDKTTQKTSRAYPCANTTSSSSFNSSDPYKQFTANPATLINEFAAYLHQKKGREDRFVDHEDGNTTALLGKFAGFLADADCLPQQDKKATYLINRLPSRVLGFKSPMEIVKNRKLDLSHLKVFGCICFVHVQSLHRDKLDPRATKCIFLGYSSTKKGYKCYNPQLKRLIVSKDVRFHETNPYYSKSLDSTSEGEYCLDLFPLPRTEILATEVTQPNAMVLVHHTKFPAENDNQASSNKTNTSAENEYLHSIAPEESFYEFHPPARLQDFVTYKPRHPLSNYMSYHKLSPKHTAFLCTISEHVEPQSFQEANQSPVWQQAIIEKLPKGKKTVGCRWIYKVKFNSDGSIERHKARLVARGFTQTFDVDYKETFAPVAKMNSVRVLLSVAVNKGWPMYQMDVKNAFLHAWYAKLSSVLTTVGFKRSNADSSLFVRTGTAGKLVVLVYVDDLIITGDNTDEITKLKHSLQQRFAIKDLGILRYFLGIEMATSHKGFFLSQRKYVLDLLKEANMSDAKPIHTPLDMKLKLSLEGQPLPNISYYQRLVGKLIYLTITRPDIAYSHFNLVKRLLRYLKGSVGRGIIMEKNESTEITGYCDADWAGNSIDRKSTTGYCTFVGGNLVTWKSKKQAVVARSSTEAEYRAMASTACELIWLKGLLCDLGVFTPQSMSLFCDNQAAMHIASNPVFHERTKHIEVDCHYVRAQVQSQVIKTHFVKSYDQLADLFTKPLASPQFQRLLGKLGSINLLDPA
ncbi:hypothetical protein D8674_039240 [Pyrus ussuriensis x Pyrus communis]|uniref:Reverse transcriptase Ty1/copia-type domain-containing protein n=1 Tax=Pyrus ussuriensis x Pyrus communis TaxID=2448454 RepID=A0A5N5IS89_9ROSA|nr:hypothetical protein D8674_040668 [Pyrus ussuriensis x Pyrus communis]KAB2637664.1 hypothetical protein D8674_039240 [Pyrus ussuriensis x Pyrus communis]